MSQFIQKERTVYTLNGSKPLYLYSEYDKCMFEVGKQQPQTENRSRIDKFLTSIFGKSSFYVSRHIEDEQINAISSSAGNVIINMPLGERCLIGAREEGKELEAGMLFATYPDLVTGNYLTPAQDDLPKFAINFFANKFGETSVDDLAEKEIQESLASQTETVNLQTETSQIEGVNAQNELQEGLEDIQQGSLEEAEVTTGQAFESQPTGNIGKFVNEPPQDLQDMEQ